MSKNNNYAHPSHGARVKARSDREKVYDGAFERTGKYHPTYADRLHVPKGLLRQEARAIRQQWTSARNEAYYQNGREWMNA